MGNNIKYVINMLLSGIFIVMFVHMIQYMYYIVTPRANYFTYFQEYSEKIEYNIGEDVYFVSEAEFKRDMRLFWADSLYCKDNWEFKKYSRFDVLSGLIPKKDFDGEGKIWKYNAEVPEYETECYLENKIDGYLPYGIIKTQISITPTFKILEEEKLSSNK